MIMHYLIYIILYCIILYYYIILYYRIFVIDYGAADFDLGTLFLGLN